MTPREELHIVLKPSKIHGVGVFTEREIHKGQTVAIWESRDWRSIPTRAKGRFKEMCEHFGDGEYIPESFVRMSLSWYLNHSDNPNCCIDERGYCRVLRCIESGEELTIDYSTLPKGVKIP
jgi:SET domain-containing protein